MTDPLYWQTAERVCTPKQLRVLELRDRHGFSLRTISLTTGQSVWTVRTHLERARQQIALALKEPA